MPPKKVNQTKTSVSDEVFTDEDGKNHSIECSGPGQDGNGCVAWVPVWLPTRCQKISLSDPFFVVTVPLRKLKGCGRKLMVIEKYKRLGSQICFYRMPMNNTDEEKMSEFWSGRANRRRCVSAGCGCGERNRC